MEIRNCIYTAFYTNLKSYDGNDTGKEHRLKLLDYCIKSYKKFNPSIEFIIDYVDYEIENTAQMYFDKMVRIKNLNKIYNVLWVDADTICLGDLSEIFLHNKPKGRFWGFWDGFNLINGGMVYYPKGSLCDYFDKFSKDWVKVLSNLLDKKEKFIGPWEQIPITNFILNSYNKEYDSHNFSIFYNYTKLKENGILFDEKYNINIFLMFVADTQVIQKNQQGLFCKKVLHFNSSNLDNNDAKELILYICDILLNKGVAESTTDIQKFQNICKELNLDNNNLIFNFENNQLFVDNRTASPVQVILSNTKDVSPSSAILHPIINPGNWFTHPVDESIDCILIINTITGEIIEI